MIRFKPIVYSQFRSDGGAMFGLVPRPIWSQLLEPNARNGIPQNANGLLVILPDGRRGIVDTGCGDPAGFSEKSRKIHGLEKSWLLPQHLLRNGLSPDEVDFVIFTHLHWDHAGGARYPDGSALFPKAAFYIHEEEWNDARSGNPLLYKSYPAETVRQVALQEKIHLVRGDMCEILPGIRMLKSGGHTRGHCSILLDQSCEDLGPGQGPNRVFPGVLFAGDVCPTQHHLRLVFQTAYDTLPLDTRQWKRTWLPHCASSGIPLFFSHDPQIAGALIVPDEKHEFVVQFPFPSPASWLGEMTR